MPTEVTDPAILAQLNGTSSPMMAPQPMGDPIVKRAPTKEPKTSYRTLSPAEAQANGLPAGGVYQISSEGNISTVSAAPKDAAGGGKAVPDSAAKRVEGSIGSYTSLKGSLDSFKDDYAGNTFFGGLENTIQGLTGFGTPGQRDWWANFQATDNQIRNELFGSALTATEKAAYEGTSISPRMAPAEIRKNLERRSTLLQTALDRQRRFMVANGYNAEAVDVLYEPIMAMQALQGSAEAATGKNTASPWDNPDTRQQVVQGSDKLVSDPQVASQLDAMLKKGVGFSEVNNWLQSQGLMPMAPRDYADVRKAIKTGQPYSVTAQKRVELTPREQQSNNFLQGGTGSFLASATDAMTGGNMDTIAGWMGGDPAKVRRDQDAIASINPGPSVAGMVTGGTLGALGIEGGLGAAGMGAGRSVAADTLYGVLAGAGGADTASDGSEATLGDRALGATQGGLAGLIGNRVASTITRGASGVSNPTVNAMRNEGIPMTLGQIVSQSGKLGASIKGMEDRVAGLPVVGDIVNARRTEGVQAFNTKAFDKALEPIGGNVAGKTAADAVGSAQQQVQDAFATALQGKAVSADTKFANDLTNASTRTMAIGKVGPDVAENIRAILEPHMTGAQFTGEGMQIISRELRDLKAAYRTKEPAYSKRIGEAIDATEEAVFGMFRRQAPEVLPAYNAAKKAFRRVSILADAVNAADNQADGLFTPAQLNRADKNNAKKYEGSMSAAAGPRQFREYASAANAVLPNKVPDSGTAGRLILPAVATGMVGADAYAGDGVNPGTLALATVLAGAYSKAGQRVLTRGAVRNPKTQRAITAGTATSAAALTSQ